MNREVCEHFVPTDLKCEACESLWAKERSEIDILRKEVDELSRKLHREGILVYNLEQENKRLRDALETISENEIYDETGEWAGSFEASKIAKQALTRVEDISDEELQKFMDEYSARTARLEGVGK